MLALHGLSDGRQGQGEKQRKKSKGEKGEERTERTTRLGIARVILSDATTADRVVFTRGHVIGVKNLHARASEWLH